MSSRAGKTVLVVDDELEIASAVQSILEDEGFDVITAGDGREALAVLEARRPDVILMDVMMPHLSGYDVLDRLDGSGRQRTAPVILMSCVRPQAAPARSRWQHFLKKPFSIEELVAVVRRFSGG